MITALRSAVYEALKREEETFNTYTRFENTAKDDFIRDFFRMLANDVKIDINILKQLNLHSIVKFGLAIKFQVSNCQIDKRTVKNIKDVTHAKEMLKLAINNINVNIEYYEHIAEHALFPEVKRLFHIIGDKELEHKCKLKALLDLIE